VCSVLPRLTRSTAVQIRDRSAPRGFLTRVIPGQEEREAASCPDLDVRRAGKESSSLVSQLDLPARVVMWSRSRGTDRAEVAIATGRQRSFHMRPFVGRMGVWGVSARIRAHPGAEPNANDINRLHGPKGTGRNRAQNLAQNLAQKENQRLTGILAHPGAITRYHT
jgi:hypothetical protein